MMILGPLVAPSTSTVTPALSRPVAVTVSPSTVITTGSVSVSPTAASVLSISMTSPTATFCCLLPARTIAYTAVSFVVKELLVCRPEIVGPGSGARPSVRADGHAGTHRGSMLRGACRGPQNGSTPTSTDARGTTFRLPACISPVDRRQAAAAAPGGP